MRVVPTAIPDVKIIFPAKHGDERGFFSETWSRRTYESEGFDAVWVQDNHARSRDRGVVRGLHFQIGAAAQTKLVRVIKGSIFDVAVDLRRNSATFGRIVHVVLSAAEWNQIWVPKGFAHGYCTLEPDTEVAYKVDAFYSPENDRGILWNDPDLAIPWPVSAALAQLSGKDQNLPRFSAVPACF